MQALQRKIDTYINDNEQAVLKEKKGAHCYEESTKNVFKYPRLEINFVINGNEFKFQFACIFERRENLVSNFTLLHSS